MKRPLLFCCVLLLHMSASFAVISTTEFERLLGPDEISLGVSINQIWKDSNIQYKISPQFKSALMRLLLQGTSPSDFQIAEVRRHLNQLSHVQKKAFLRALSKWLRENGYTRTADALEREPAVRWYLGPWLGGC